MGVYNCMYSEHLDRRETQKWTWHSTLPACHYIGGAQPYHVSGDRLGHAIAKTFGLFTWLWRVNFWSSCKSVDLDRYHISIFPEYKAAHLWNLGCSSYVLSNRSQTSQREALFKYTCIISKHHVVHPSIFHEIFMTLRLFVTSRFVKCTSLAMRFPHLYTSCILLPVCECVEFIFNSSAP